MKVREEKVSRYLELKDDGRCILCLNLDTKECYCYGTKLRAHGFVSVDAKELSVNVHPMAASSTATLYFIEPDKLFFVLPENKLNINW